MTKIEAVQALVNDECDDIRFEKFVFVLEGGAIIDKESRRQMEMCQLTQDGWNLFSAPGWYENLDTKPILCKVVDKKNGFFIACGIDNGLVLDYRNQRVCAIDDVAPASIQDIGRFIFSPTTATDYTDAGIVSLSGISPSVTKHKSRILALGLRAGDFASFVEYFELSRDNILGTIALGDDHIIQMIEEYYRR